jgi:hypothetical protein
MIAGIFTLSIAHPFSDNIEPFLIFSILLFTGSCIVLFLALIIMRIRKANFAKRLKFLKLALNNSIVSAAFAATDGELIRVILRAKPKFSKHIKNAKQARVIIDEILTMHGSLTGESKSNLSQLFQTTCVMDYTLHDLENKSWHIKASAIQDLAQIGAETYIPKIEKYAIDPNISLQQVAQIALVNSRGYNGLDFLSKLDNVLSDWQQINLLDSLRKLEKKDAPDFSQWLTHKQDTVKLFAMRLIHDFHQTYNCEKLEEFIHNKNMVLRNEAFVTIKKISPAYQFAD